MKKFVTLLLAMLLICCMGSAMAADYKPGDTITMNIAITGSTGDGAARVSIDIGDAPVSFVSATAISENGNIVQVPQNLKGRFGVMNAEGVVAGKIGTLTVSINANAKPGTYSIIFSGSMAATGVSGSITFTVVSNACTTHTWSDKLVVKKEATCTDDGIGYKVCTVCGEKGTETTIPATGHTAGTPFVQKAATCTENGLRVTLCATCETEMDSEVIPATGHKAGETVITSQPTCTKTGTQVTKCANCPEVIPDSAEEIPALGHDLVIDAAVAATCTQEGLTEGKHCTRCDYKVAQEATAKLQHNMDKVENIGASCTAPGTKKYYCTMCGKLQKTEDVAALGHTIVIDEAVAATCTKDGLTEGKHCSVCNEVIVKQEKIPAAHTPGKEAVRVEPTCTKDGSISYVCSVCGKKISSEKLPALGHKYDDGVVTKAATCTEDGVKTYTCQNAGCGKTKTEKIKKIGHKYDDGVVTKAATCTEDGVKTYTCQNDQSHVKTEKIKKLGHKYGAWVITKPVTDTENGEQQRTCATCGYIETQVILCANYFHNTACVKGIRFRDYDASITDKWYMFAPIDISVDGEQVFDLVAGNMHTIGTVHVLVKEGTVTITYELANEREISVKSEFVTLLPSIADAANADTDKMTQFVFGEPISIADDLGGDTKVLLYVLNNVVYEEKTTGIQAFEDNKDYEAYVETLKTLMD